ncbi:MAG: hypothetical protein OXF26_13635, partial [Alphaproteobacteria bacterium]|nr:hypothetical protein [Alphaproteobacteria bacterium]
MSPRAGNAGRAVRREAVNDGLLRDAGFTLPPDAKAWDGISVEQAYDQCGDGGDPSPGGGNVGGAGSDDPGKRSSAHKLYDASLQVSMRLAMRPHARAPSS